RRLQLGVLAHDRHRDLERLLVVQARVHRGAVGALEVELAQVPGPARALGDVLAGELEVHAAQARARRRVQVEALLDLAADVVEAAGLVAVAGGLGVAVHRVADPQHAPAFAAHGLQQRRQPLRPAGRAQAADEGPAAG